MTDPKHASEPSTAIATINQCTTLIAIPEHWAKGQGDGEYVTTADVNKEHGQQLVLDALNGQVVDFADTLNKELKLVGFTLSPASKVDEDSGEEKRLIRTILHTGDGACICTFSVHVLRDLRTIVGLKGIPSTNRPLKVMPLRVKTSDTRSMYRLRSIK